MVGPCRSCSGARLAGWLASVLQMARCRGLVGVCLGGCLPYVREGASLVERRCSCSNDITFSVIFPAVCFFGRRVDIVRCRRLCC